MPLVNIADVKKSYGPLEVLKGVSIEIEKGEIIASGTPAQVIAGYKKRNSITGSGVMVRFHGVSDGTASRTGVPLFWPGLGSSRNTVA